jgi:DNA-directed RNA polymerase subunit omega
VWFSLNPRVIQIPVVVPPWPGTAPQSRWRGAGSPVLAGRLRITLSDERQNVAGTQPLGAADGIINPPIDELLEVVDSKYRLVIMAAKRARQINAYYSQLGEGLLEYVGPLVETRSQEKPLSISLREIKERLLNVEATEG